MSNNITPFVKRMRTQGGTMYTFSSAVEDIGLNINERNNIVEMSNFALLDIPNVEPNSNLQQNKFNVLSIPGALENQELSGGIKDGRIVIAESFQNYALNLEANLLNQSNYNPSLQKTVSERVFWKWLKETGAIRWIKDMSNPGYFVEESDTDASSGYNSIVKYIGQINAGAVRTDNHGTYNETYVLVPTSHGQTLNYFKRNYDDNFMSGMSIGPSGENILGRESYTQPHPDGLSLLGQYDHMISDTLIGGVWATETNGTPGTWCTAQSKTFPDDYYYATDASAIIDSSINYVVKYTNGGDTIEFQRSNVDAIELEYNIANLRDIVGDSTLTYDKIAIDYAIDNTFNFNAILVYYSIYNKAKDKKIATNLLGVLFLDTASGNTSGFPDMNITIPTITKLQSNGAGFGSSYSFRINIKSDNMLDDTQAIIQDESTSSQTSLENWTDVLSGLSESLSILNQNSNTINYITEQYMNISSIQTQQGNIITDLQYQINDVVVDIKGTNNTIPLFIDGDDPLVDSSIYMRSGKIGMFNNDPKYDVHLSGDIKVDDIHFENSIKDASTNTILSYDSNTINLGLNNVSKDIYFYAGIDTSPKAVINSAGNLLVSNTVVAPSAMPSDIKLKDNIVTIENSLDTILQLNGVTFDWKTDGKHSSGFIAQEIEKVIPSVVDSVKLIGEKDFTKVVHYTGVIPYLVEAIKEQNKQIVNLRNELNELKK